MKQFIIGFFILLYSIPVLGRDLIDIVVRDETDIVPMASVCIKDVNINSPCPTDCNGSKHTITTDIDGKFSFKNGDDNFCVIIRNVGSKTATYRLKDVPNIIKLTDDTIVLSEVEVLGSNKCTPEELRQVNASDGQKWQGKCIPYECISARYKLNEKKSHLNTDGEKILEEAECVDTNGKQCDTMPPNATEAVMQDGVCTIKKCNEPQYKLINNECVDQAGGDCSISNAKSAKREMVDGQLKCIVTECNDNYAPNSDNTKCEKIQKCDATADSNLRATDANITKTKYENGQCIVAECAKNYKPSDDKKTCIQNKGDCTPTAAHATSGNMKNGICYVSACDSGWHVSKDKTKCEQAELSKEDSQKKIDELQKNADKMKEKEQSTANKLLGGAAIGATGIGAMNLMEGLAEQKADDAIEQEMKAYLETFTCDYGQGRNIKGGTREVELPGATQLFAQVNEYKALAADLKARKEALGLRAGIESEVILDKAETGLYDDVGVGITSGAYTSVARALQDPTGKDAESWAKTKQDAHDKKNKGLITAGVGAIGGAIGNLAINHGDDKKNKANEINKKYERLKQPLEQLEIRVNALPPATTLCPTGATGAYPDCTCSGNKVHNPNTNTCDACEYANQTVVDGQCKCPTGTREDAPTKTCVTETQTCTNTCPRGSTATVENNCECRCTDPNAELASNATECTCKEGFSGSPCSEEQPEEPTVVTLDPINLKSGMLFANDSSRISDNAKNILTQFATTIADADCTINITGYADRTGSTPYNKTLSENRAKSVADILKPADSTAKFTVSFEGKGENECTCGLGDAQWAFPSDKQNDKDYKVCSGKNYDYAVPDGRRYAPCRRIKISGKCTVDDQNAATTINSAIQTLSSTVQ